MYCSNVRAFLRIDLQDTAVARRLLVPGHRVQPGIAEHLEVRPAADAIERVGGVDAAGLRHRRRHRGEVPAGGEAHHPDPIRRDVELGRMRADEPHRAPRIDERRRIEVAVAEPVLENERRDAASGEPVRHLPAFEVGGEAAVGAAGRDHDGGAAPRAGMHPEHRQRGHVRVFGPLRPGRVAFPQAVGGGAEKGVRRSRRSRWRRAGLCRRRGGARDRQADQDSRDPDEVGRHAAKSTHSSASADPPGRPRPPAPGRAGRGWGRRPGGSRRRPPPAWPSAVPTP